MKLSEKEEAILFIGGIAVVGGLIAGGMLIGLIYVLVGP